jgi:hypothetical protein
MFFARFHQSPPAFCSLSDLGVLDAWLYPFNAILPLDERGFGWSQGKGFYKNGMHGLAVAASIRAWQ